MNRNATVRRFPKAEILEILRKNRETHIKNAEEAQEIYQKQVVKHLQEQIERVSNGDPLVPFAKQAPRTFEKEYNKFIRMFELQVGDEVELTTEEFNQFVMDEWGWSQQFAMTTMQYCSERE